MKWLRASSFQYILNNRHLFLPSQKKRLHEKRNINFLDELAKRTFVALLFQFWCNVKCLLNFTCKIHVLLFTLHGCLLWLGMSTAHGTARRSLSLPGSRGHDRLWNMVILQIQWKLSSTRLWNSHSHIWVMNGHEFINEKPLSSAEPNHRRWVSGTINVCVHAEVP